MIFFQFNKNLVAVVCALSVLFLSNSGSFPTSRTGAPSESDCSSCHANNGGFSGDISVAGLPATATANTTYNLTITVNATGGSPVRAGFSTTALDGSDVAAGDWSNAGSDSSIKNAMSREYFGHQPAVTFGGGGSVSWDADWTAPNINDDVTFYIAALLANGSGTAGDNVLLLEETVTVMPAASAIAINFINITATTCNGNDDGFAEAVGSNGTSPYEYEWDNGADTAGATLSGGTHSVTVTDDTGMTAEADVNIPEPALIDLDSDTLEPDCNGDANGSIEIFASGGTGDLECTWANLPDGCVQNNLEAGSYSVTVTDENGCTEFETITVSEPSALANAFIQIVNESTPGAADGSAMASVSGGTPPYSYNWSNGMVGETISGLSAGTYCVNILDQNDCTIQTCALVMTTSAPCSISLNPNVMNVSCAGASSGAVGLFIMGGTTPLEYAWSNNTTAANITNVPAGNYSVTVSDAAGCTQTLSNIVVAEPDSLAVGLTQMLDASCATSQDGSLIVNVSGGTQGYDLVWSNGLINDTTIVNMIPIINIPDTLENLNPGSYSYVLTDANGCTEVGTYILMNNDSIPPIIMVQEAVVELDANGVGTLITLADITTSITDNCEVSGTNFASVAYSCADIGINTVEVTATDGNGNVATAIATVQVVEYIDPVIDCSSSSVTANTCGAVTYPTPTATDNCDIPVILLESGLASGSVFPSGESLVTYQALDECGNLSSCTFSIIVTNDLSANVTTTPGSCGSTTGSLTITPSGGTPPYSSSPFTLGTSSNLASGNYSVTVTDSGGCTSAQSVTIGTSDGPQIELLQVESSGCAGESSGMVRVQASGGTPPYRYRSDLGSLNAPTTSFFVFANVPGGVITIEVLDANDCEDIIEVQVPFTPNPDIVINDLSIACFGGSTTLDTSFPGFTIDGLPAFLVAGSYTVTVTDDNTGCSSTTSFNVTAPSSALAVSNIGTSNDDGCTFSEEDITFDITGGTPPYNSSVTDAGTSLFGPYVITVVDAAGCEVQMDYQDISLVFSILEITDIMITESCSEGMITASVSGGCSPYDITVDPPAQANGFYSPGSYTVLAIDQVGNAAETIVTINGVIILSNDLVIEPFDGAAASIQHAISGGAEPYMFEWLDADGNVIGTEEDLVINAYAGDVVLIVTDAAGCIAEFSFFIPFDSAAIDVDEDNVLVSIYPNPVMDDLYLEFNSEIPEQIDVYTTSGQRLQSHHVEASRNTFDAKEFDAGVYVIRAKFGDRYVVKTFVKL